MTARDALRSHWPEYAMEAAGLGAFMLSACLFAALFERVHDGAGRRALMGLAMGLTAAALIHSPWGKRSGAHLNPALTLAYFRLGRVPAHDAIFYAISQVGGGVAGVGLAWLIAGPRVSGVHFAATVPGPTGVVAAFFAEALISFGMMTAVLRISSSRFARWTGVAAATLVALYIFLESPISGMSMNPARTLASALAARNFTGLWIYFAAPVLGMLAAAAVHREPGCAKLDHAAGVKCIFCEQRSPPASKQRIVILGGGFGGIYVAQELEKSLVGRDDYEIVLVSKENYFVFQPMLPEVISGTIGLTDLVSPIRRLCPLTQLHVREIESIDLHQRTVTTVPGLRPHRHVIQYDHLVIALGTVTDFRGLRGLAEHALPFKNLEDALHLRDRVIRALEEAAVEQHDAQLRRELLTFVVAGGGFSGVEAAAELNDFVRQVARSYPQIDPAEIRVVLVHSQDRILPEVSEKLGLFAQRRLQERGVEILLNTRLSAATGAAAVLGDGCAVPTRTLVSTVPSFPHPLVEGLAAAKSKNGRLLVDSHMRLQGFESAWALGDCAQVPIRDGGISPPTAQHAIRQGKVLARNLVAAIRGGALSSFDFKGLGKMGSLGRHSAVADILGLNISGPVAWFLWRTIYLMKLPGFGRKLKVAASWAFDLFLPPELVLFRFGGQTSFLREHFEAGQEVFHEGDLGDRIYAIMSGEAEVVVERGGSEHVLARLGPGELFGERAVLEQATRNATIRCSNSMNVWSLPKAELALLAAGMPELRRSLEDLRERRNKPVPVSAEAGPTTGTAM